MRRARAAATAVAAAILLGGCAGGANESGVLPGPVPADVTFYAPPTDAPPAPVLTLELLDGDQLALAEQWAQRPVVLVFFESWCTRCGEQQDGINEVVARYQDVVLFVGIASQSDPAEVERYVSEHQITYPVGIDPSGRSALRYAVAEPPLVALISKGGQLLRGWPEGISGEDLAEHIATLAVQTP